MEKALKHSLAFVISIGLVCPIGVAQAAARVHASTAPTWRIVFLARLRSSNAVVSITALGPKDAWAAGELDRAHNNTFGYLKHWNGAAWRTVTLPVAGFLPAAVRASAPGNVWVVGETDHLSVVEALRWDGFSWHVVPMANEGVNDPVVLGPADVWADGAANWSPSRGWRSFIWHWNGVAWTKFTLPIPLGPIPLAGSSGRDVWAVGTNSRAQNPTGGRLVAYRWNGTSWRLANVPHPRVRGLPDVTVGSAANIWITGGGLILHWNGSRWARLRPAPGAFGPAAPVGREGAWFGPNVLWTGRRWVDARSAFSHCPISSFDEIAAIPGGNGAWQAGACQASGGTGRREGMIARSRFS